MRHHIGQDYTVGRGRAIVCYCKTVGILVRVWGKYIHIFVYLPFAHRRPLLCRRIYAPAYITP